jgi:hypothetical protein
MRPKRQSIRRSLALGGGALAAAMLALLALLVAPGSASTSVAAPTNTVPPSIAGPTAVGGVLTASTGTWSGDTPIAFRFQWRACDGNGADCAEAAGATGQTYAIPAGAVGRTLRVAVTGSNSAGAGTALSAPTAAIEAATAPVNTAPPSISGTARQGETLTTSNGSWTGSPPPAFRYGWLRCNSEGNSCVAIASQSARTYGLSAADVGATIRSIVTASNAAGEATAGSSPTAVVSAAGDAPHPTSQPDITGTLAVGQTLTAGTGKAWTGSTPITYSFSWQRCDSRGHCSTIASATKQTYVPTNADIGFRLRAIVTGTNAYGSGSVTTNLTAGPIVASGPKPALRAAPTLTGSTEVGSTLTTTTGTWSPTALHFAYGWLRCDARGNACAPIPGAAATSYTLTSADAAHTIRSQVMATAATGSASATSAASAIVGSLPAGVVRLPAGGYSIPVEDVSLPQRLIISGVSFSPRRLTSRAPFSARFRVTDTRGYAVRGALVYLIALPYGLVRSAPEVSTDMNGEATMTLQPTSNLRLRSSAIVMFVRARKESGSLLGGVSTRRLVQIRVGR